MKDRIVLHADANAFFASVECLLNPELNKFPMAVCGDPAKRHGIILAKNEKAKKFGVVTAETIWSAKKKCPALVLAPPHRAEYEKYSKLCNEIYLRFTDLVERFGVDESYLDITGSLHLFGDGKTVADTIRQTVREETGLPVSVGVSFCKAFAKIGSDYRKPDFTTVIARKNWRSIIFPLPANALMGVGRKADEILAGLGVRTIGDLARYNRAVLTNKLGSLGGQIHDHANGLDDAPVASYYEQADIKSVGNGTTFEHDVTTWSDLKPRVIALCDSVGSRLRKHGLKCRTLQVAIKYPDFHTVNRQKPLDAPTNLTKELTKTALELIAANWKEGRPIRLVTITASKLVGADAAAEQLSFFTDASKTRKAEQLQSAIDHIRDKYGRSSIGDASGLKLADLEERRDGKTTT